MCAVAHEDGGVREGEGVSRPHQGEGWFVLNQATRLGLAGWVENLPDGAVEVVAEGSVNQLMELERELSRGPRFSRVEHVERVDFPHEVDGVKGFEIK